MTDLASSEQLSTEEKIRQAAIEVFMLKGYDGAKTRDIANAAGINIATLHYHYRTKDKLFHLVAKESMEEFSAIFHNVFSTQRPLQEKIHLFVNDFTSLFSRKPDLAMFCLMETQRNHDKFTEIIDFRRPVDELEPQLDALISSGEIRPISVPNFISSLVGMTIYPFITKASLYYANDLDDAGFEAVLEQQRKIIPAMIIGYLWKTN